MARIQYSYNPLDLEPDIAIGIKLPFNSATKGKNETGAVSNYSSTAAQGGLFVLSYSTEEQAISNLKNLILTRKGERLMQPDFGTNLYDYLFEQNTIDLRETIQTELENDIKFWLPYIIIDNLTVTGNEDAYSIAISIVFRVTQQGYNQTITVFVSQNGINIV